MAGEPCKVISALARGRLLFETLDPATDNLAGMPYESIHI
jgi:hypothetical protein